MHTHLIMVEGVPFTGKSTLSEFVAQQLGLNGISAQWVPEGVMWQQYFPRVLADLDQDYAVSQAVVRSEWSAFVQTVMSAGTTFVVDAALSFAAIYPLQAVDRPAAVIHAELAHIAAMCTPLRPQVIHLTGDMDRLARASIVERGPAWQEQLVGQSDTAPFQQARGRSGLGGAIAFLEDSQALTRMILADIGWPTLTLDVTTADWDTNRRAVLDFLDIPEVRVDRPVLTRAALEGFAGTYAAEDPESLSATLSVRLEQNTLALHGPQTRYGPLVPISATRFHLTATPVDAEFVVEEGLARRLVLFRSNGKQDAFRRI